jgi:hypothetical protein
MGPGIIKKVSISKITRLKRTRGMASANLTTQGTELKPQYFNNNKKSDHFN